MELQEIPWPALTSVLFWLVVLIAATAVFVAGEYALVLSRKTRMTTLMEQGSSAARVVLRVMEDRQRFLAGIQVGITLTSLALGALTEQPLSEIFAALMLRTGSGWLDPAARGIGTLLALALAAYLQVIFGELLPRALTLRSAERIALLIVPPLHALTRLISPFTWFLNKSSALVQRLIGLKHASDEKDHLHSADEIRMLVEESEKGGLIEREQGALLDKVFSFGDTTVREVMMPRTEIAAVEVGASMHSIAHVFSQRAYSRIPVYEDSIDNVIGILHSRDLIRMLLAADRTRQPTLRQLLREPYFVPDSQRVDEVLAGFRKRREYMAVVLDEYGGTAGIVTLNDLVSRLIGEVQDSAQPNAPDILRSADGSAQINGLTTIGDVNDAFDLKLTDDNYDTVGGYIMGRLGRIPRVGDTVQIDDKGTQLRVEAMDKLRVEKVRLTRKGS